MSLTPQLGPFWQARKPSADMDLLTCRAGASLHFDNGARLKGAHRVQEWWERLAPIISPRFHPLLEDSPRGDPVRSSLLAGGTLYMATVSSVEFAAMASTLVPALESAGATSVIEIGGGYGGLASAVLRAMPALKSWVIVDIPEVARVSRWYLQPDPRAQSLDTHSPEFARLLPAGAVIQTRGFMEMSNPELKHYFSLIQDGSLLTSSGLLYTVNRVRKMTRFADYPFDERWEVLHKRRWPEGGGAGPLIEVLLQRTEQSRGSLNARLGPLLNEIAA